MIVVQPLQHMYRKLLLQDSVRLGVLVRMYARWWNASPMRRRIVWTLATLCVLAIVPGALGAIARAQTGSTTTESSLDALSWMNIHDTAGVPLTDYTFATDHGGVLHPVATILSVILGLEFIGYLVIVTSAVWMIGYAVSFQWLDPIGRALTAVARRLTGQIATPIILITAASIGAFFVAWFIVRGYYAKATLQVVTMLIVAVLGPITLADPLEDVLSSHGLLARGRDLGISVAVGLFGGSTSQPDQLVIGLQGELADNFARKPLQVWNFGHVVDESPRCRAAWTAGIESGHESQVLDGIRQCGDSTAYAKARNPSLGQVGSGLMLLVCAAILLCFGQYLGLKIIWAALDSIYYSFRAIFGLAAGGFIYGPTQTALLRDIVDIFIAAARMTLFIIFLGIYVQFLGALFEQAQGHVMTVLVLGANAEFVGIVQLRHLNASLSRGSNWVTNRFALAIQNSGRSSGAGGGTALGMGYTNVRSQSGAKLLFAVSALNAVNTSPITGWLAGGTKNPLDPLARGRRRVDRTNIEVAPMQLDFQRWQTMARENWRLKAWARAEKAGGIHNELGLQNALDGLGDSRVPDTFVASTLLSLGATNAAVSNGQRAIAVQNASMSRNPYGFVPLQKALAAARAVENHVDDPAHAVFAAQALVSANNFLRHTNAPAAGSTDVDHAFVARVLALSDSEIALRSQILPDEWNSASRDTRWAIGDKLATDHQATAAAYWEALNDPNRTLPLERYRLELMNSARRISNLDHLEPDTGLDPWDP
ncbi:hypothetical protein ACQP2U_24525 [Nocardia sp. CA-084685]|uniref:hypothetical protein n=1 Tax=Nocardia sp. CA-084685 TaxID=3239970 RepID=UPI003D98D436